MERQAHSTRSPGHSSNKGSLLLLGKVAGTVIASGKEEKLEGIKLPILTSSTSEGQIGSGYVMAVDAVVMAIIDQWAAGGERNYHRAEGEYQP